MCCILFKIFEISTFVVSSTYEYETKNKFNRFIWFKFENVRLEKNKERKTNEKNHKYSNFYGKFKVSFIKSTYMRISKSIYCKTQHS